MEAVNGMSRELKVGAPGRSQQTIKVDIPPGVSPALSTVSHLPRQAHALHVLLPRPLMAFFLLCKCSAQQNEKPPPHSHPPLLRKPRLVCRGGYVLLDPLCAMFPSRARPPHAHWHYNSPEEPRCSQRFGNFSSVGSIPSASGAWHTLHSSCMNQAVCCSLDISQAIPDWLVLALA